MENKRITGLEKIIIFLCIVFKYFISYTITKRFLYIFLTIIMLLVLIDLYYKKFTKREFLTIILFFICSLYFVLIYEDVNFLISVCLGVLFFENDKKKFVKVFTIASVFMFLTTIVLSKIGFLESHNMIRYTETGTKIRYSFGFTHPNEVFLFFLPIALGLYYLYDSKKVYFLIIFSSLILYIYSDSRTGIISIILLFIFNFFIKNKRCRVQDKIIKLMPYMMFIFTIFSIIVTIRYGTDSKGMISRFLSGRPYYWNYYINNDLLFSLFGKNKIEGYFLDNYYLYILVELGMISYIIYSSIYYIYYKKIGNNLSRKELIIALVFFTYGICEVNVIIGSINFLFAMQIAYIIKDKKIKIE
ncbi:MAG TPA: hypothetical protein IAD08_06525 [Candidatus Scatovivens faecipullorum]|nr:hypothetical protein [Candidatus Scatovivens faecipullorum]